ncbi:MAG: sulfatase [bacterium]
MPRVASLVAVTLIAVATRAWAAEPTPAPATALRPSVVLVTVDTLRADALGCYGAGAGATPNLDRVAAEGAQFLNAACPMPHTRPSHFSILTGLYPRDHGVVNNLIALPEQATTLAEVLSDAGYASAAFVGAVHLNRASGAAQGFDELSAPAEPATWTADQVVSRALAWLRNAANQQRPFLLWIHLFDPHLPYAPPAAFRPPSPAGALSEVSWPILLDVARQHGGDVPGAVRDRARALYQGEARFVDHEIGRVIELLREHDRLDRTILAVTADHGECFDHGVFFDHSDCLYDGAIQVPLLVRYPPAVASAQRLGGQVELRRLPATILRLAGIAAPPPFEPETLFEQAADPHAMAFVERAFYPAGSAERRDQRLTTIRTVGGEPIRPLDPEQDWVGVRTSAWKYLRMGERRELYDLTADPRERANVSAERPAIRDPLDAALTTWLGAHPIRVLDAGQINERLRESLEALGYTH